MIWLVPLRFHWKTHQLVSTDPKTSHEKNQQRGERAERKQHSVLDRVGVFVAEEAMFRPHHRGVGDGHCDNNESHAEEEQWQQSFALQRLESRLALNLAFSFHHVRVGFFRSWADLESTDRNVGTEFLRL